MSKEEIKKIAVEGVALVKKLLPELANTDVQLEYSPESFSDTEVEYALEVCEAVMEAWEPTTQSPIILNLPPLSNCSPLMFMLIKSNGFAAT